VNGAQLIYGALRLLGVLRPGMTANASSMTDGLSEANDLLDNWNTDRLKVFSIFEQSFALTTGQLSYTLGTGGQWNAPRPVKIEGASLIVNYSGIPTVTPLKLLTDPEYQAISVPSISSTIPYWLYCDYAFPLAHCKVFPVPADPTALVELSMWQQFTAFPDLTTNVNFPPGYALALRYNLAVQMAASFQITAKVAPNLELIVGLAKQYRADIEALNSFTPTMRTDVSKSARGRFGSYNWLINE
jgi:hypothetical protein